MRRAFSVPDFSSLTECDCRLCRLRRRFGFWEEGSVASYDVGGHVRGAVWRVLSPRMTCPTVGSEMPQRMWDTPF